METITKFKPKYRLLTQDEVAEWLGIDVRTLRNKRAKIGKCPIPFVKVGKFVRYYEQDVLKWIERNTYDRASDAFVRVG